MESNISLCDPNYWWHWAPFHITSFYISNLPMVSTQSLLEMVSRVWAQILSLVFLGCVKSLNLSVHISLSHKRRTAAPVPSGSVTKLMILSRHCWELCNYISKGDQRRITKSDIKQGISYRNMTHNEWVRTALLSWLELALKLEGRKLEKGWRDGAGVEMVRARTNWDPWQWAGTHKDRQKSTLVSPKIQIKWGDFRELLGSPVAAGGMGSIPGQGTEILHDPRQSQIN